MYWFFRLLLAAGISKAAATCLKAQAYGTADQRGKPNSTHVKDAEACQSSCASSNCKYFTYDTSTGDCWHLGQVYFIQMQETAISGTVGCLLQREDEDSRKEHVMGALKRAAEYVHDRTTSDQMRKQAKHVKWSCENGFLEEESYQSVQDVMSGLSDLVAMPDGLVEAASNGAVLTTDDVQWLTQHMKGESVTMDMKGFEDAEPGAASVACGSSNVGCDQVSGSFGAGSPWTGARVRYCFDFQLAPSSKQALQCAMEKIRSHVPGIVFQDVGYTGVDSCGASPAIYLQSNGRRSGNGCWSDIGMSSSFFGGNQKLNLQAPGCDNCGTATHELLHAMGMAHEQSRPDRDDYINIMWNNIKSGMDGQFTKNSKADTHRPYDIMSIMHYGSRSFSKNGRDTILVKPKGYQVYTTDPSQFQYYRVGQRMGMSRYDVTQLADLYGCPAQDMYRACNPAANGGGSGSGDNFLAKVLQPDAIFSDSGLVVLVVGLLVSVVCCGGVVCFCFMGGGGGSKTSRAYYRVP